MIRPSQQTMDQVAKELGFDGSASFFQIALESHKRLFAYACAKYDEVEALQAISPGTMGITAPERSDGEHQLAAYLAALEVDMITLGDIIYYFGPVSSRQRLKSQLITLGWRKLHWLSSYWVKAANYQTGHWL